MTMDEALALIAAVSLAVATAGLILGWAFCNVCPNVEGFDEREGQA